MMAWAEAVLALPGISPGAASLAALTRPGDTGNESSWRLDPGAVILFARHARGDDAAIPSQLFPTSIDDSLLLSAQAIVSQNNLAFVDWRQPGVDRVWRYVHAIAVAAEMLARQANVCPAAAWAAGLLAPLGWLGVCAADPDRILEFLDTHDLGLSDWQARTWGFEHPSLTRRLARAWRLPAWLANAVGSLDLPVTLAARLEVDVPLLAVVQLAVAWVERSGLGLGLSVGTPLAELLALLNLKDEHLDKLDKVIAAEIEIPLFEAPNQQPLLGEVLRLTLENRTRLDQAHIEKLHQDIDRLQDALALQVADERQRLLQQKLAALAEFAGGAGHEINNPLAVISGQAQYLLKQLRLAEELLVEDPATGPYVDALQTKLTKPLQTIVGQAQRIHHVITDLMQFARPQTPRPQVVPVLKLLADVALSVRNLAEERHVRLVCPEPVATLAIRVDPAQMRIALVNLLRNALEAAPAEGWASLRIEHEAGGGVMFVVEDNGPGPNASQRDHLFDPFFSGRSAGRGRGLGLSTAWRLARQHGGDVAFDATAQGVTRFTLTLPARDVLEGYVPVPHANGNGNGHVALPRHGSSDVGLVVRN